MGPVLDDELAIGGLGKQKAIWPALIQKAAGRYIGSYSAMDYAEPAFSLGMLTGSGPAFGMNASEEDDGTWVIWKYTPLSTNQPHDVDWDEHAADENESEFPRDEVMGKIEELQS